MAAPAEHRQLAPLVRTFLARFFENDLTASAHDLKRSFFGLVAFLGIPGAMVPILMSFNWSLIGRFQGVAALRHFARADKDLYLAFTMIAAATLCALTWDTLLIDRRDGIILGSLPVRGRTIVIAKLVALATYVGAVAIAMHTLSAATWGLSLGQGRGTSFSFIVRGMAAHFVAGCAASAFTVCVIASVQGVLLSIAGPTIFRKMSGVVQIGLVVAIGFAIMVLPSASGLVVQALDHPTNQSLQWVLFLPPAWFLGLYELVLGGLGRFGGADAVLRHLASVALLASTGALLTAAWSNVLASRRILKGAAGQEVSTGSRLGSLTQVVARLATRQPDLQAVAAFFLTSIIRVERQRLALSIGVGVAVAWALPTVEDWRSFVQSSTPPIGVLTLPVSLMVLWLVSLRVAASLPSDLKASWLFDVQRPAPQRVRDVMERLFVIGGVLPFALVSGLVVGRHWSADVALIHVMYVAAIGLLTVELLLNGIGDVPGTQPWRPERAHLRSRWPYYLGAFLWLASGLPVWPGWDLEPLLIGMPVFRIVFFGLVVCATLAIRWLSLERLRTRLPDDEALPEGVAVTVRLN